MRKSAVVSEQLEIAEKFAAQGRLAALGETGFDLYNAAFRETEQIQDELFAGHLELALRYNLPMVIHVRRAAHKIFAWSKKLKKCRAVIFHSWPCTAGEGEALLRRGINAFFSFGTSIMLNHREAARCCAVFPADRLLTETDAPFQPLRGNTFSRYADIISIQETVAALRGKSPAEIEKTIEENFRNAFGLI
jgi:TatD DNase family protein